MSPTKTVLITGSTRGIGLALATHFTKSGWNVIGTARATSNTDELMALSPFKVVTLDTSDEASVASATQQLEGVAIDLLINNAGTGWLTDIVPPTKQLLMNAFEVNAVGPSLVTRALQPTLELAAKDHGFASVVQLSSLLGSLNSNTERTDVFFRGQDAYSTSKAALNMVTRSLAVALCESNIAVVAIHPGYVGTDLTAGLGPLKPVDVATAISNIVTNLTLKDTGKFLNADPSMSGTELPCFTQPTPHFFLIMPDIRPAIPETWDVSKIPSLKAKLNEILGIRGSVQFLQLDVSDLKSVREFAESFKRGHGQLDLLINNAGVMGGSCALSVDGYETMFATNHLGHFALTAQLFELLKQSSASRVVNVSSGLHKRGEAGFHEDEIMVSEDKFGQVQTYGETKLCNILFTKELDRRLKAADIENVTAVACHPGYVATNLGSNMTAANNDWLYWLVIKLVTFLPGGKSPEMGAMPTLYVATGKEVVDEDYIGPKERNTGSPAHHEPAELCKSESATKKLWAFSEKLANITFVVKVGAEGKTPTIMW